MTELHEKFNSVGEILRNTAKRFPEKTLIIFKEKEFSYLQIENFSNKLASFLKRVGTGKGKNICLYCPNIPEFIISYFGIVKTGATVVPVNIFLSPEEIKYILENSESYGLIYFEGFEEKIIEIKNSLPSLLISTGEKKQIDCYSLKEIFISEKEEFEIEKVNQKEDICAILYTSGTTGKPKGAMLTHRNLLFNINSIIKAAPVSEKDIFLSVLPLFHAFGGTACMLTSIAIGATMALVLKFNPYEVAETIKKTKSTIFMGVPSMYNAFLNLPEDMKEHFSSLRFCISGGAALPVEVKEKFERKFNKIIYEGDGPIECSPVTCLNPIGGLSKPGSIGKPVPGVKMKIVDENGNELKTGEIGEIIVKGENVMKGYYKMPQETKESFLGEWFKTGDLGYVDEDGYFYIVDRKKDLIIVSGLNIYPRMIEEVIYRHPDVVEVAVVGEKNPVYGEIPKAFIKLKENSKVTKREIIDLCRKYLAKYEIPRKIEFVKELPKTSTGKIDKKLLQSKPGLA